MAYPTRYTRQYDFYTYQTANPTRPLPGDKVNVDYNYVEQSIDEIIDFLQGITRSDGAIANGAVGIDQLSAAVLAQLGLTEGATVTDYISGIMPSPSNGAYKLVVKAPYAMTISDITTIAVSGTCTATFSIDGVALGGTANSVSSVEQSQAQASANVVAAGADLTMTISANSSCANLSFTITFTRAL